ncbi:HAD family hydrolase [Parahaliea maris]|uniref:HAD family hydrolase n=1 Tax=Parahaliea maris TaxID=2716870 RepID=A0A5C9A1H1_9GAMM|nr:HAD family hydrolase [Parahaliea maris]TXS93939.1 HAD family hydrolase [Parahaliea maris]
MTLAIFDLDNTLIAGDSDHLWGCFLCDRGLVDSTEFAARNEQFYRDYQSGQLDIMAYLRFALGPLAGREPAELEAWHADFMRSVIEPIMLPAASELIEHHRRQGHRLLVITATNEFITRPIASALGIHELLACEAERVDGYYTGEPTGVPSYGAGKVTRLEAWRAEHGESLDGAWFYSDSHNDLPLLKQVENPVAVDPDETLLAYAESEGWEVISLR